jgi:hypothetical protein
VDENRARTWGQIGGLTAWSRNDAATMVGPAHRGFRARFERQVDPDGVLDPAERERRADRARKAYMLRLSARSAEARRKSKADAEDQTPASAKEARRAAGEPSAG